MVNLEWLTKLAEDVDPDGAGAATAGAADLAKTEVTDGILSIDTVSVEEFTNTGLQSFHSFFGITSLLHDLRQ